MRIRRACYVPLGIGLLLLSSGCAGKGNRVELDALTPVRGPGQEAPGEWRQIGGALVNVIPEDARPEDVIAERGGIGVSFALARDHVARDFELLVPIAFKENGVPGIIFRAQEEDGLITAMYVLVVDGGGLVLWRYFNGHWTALYTNRVFVPSDTQHLVFIRGRGDLIDLGFNGYMVHTQKDTILMEAGAVGISGRQGMCAFGEMRFRAMD